MSTAAAAPHEAAALPDALLAVAIDAALVGAAVSRPRFGQRLDVSLKSDRSEVTDVDEAAQAAVIAFIAARRTSDVFIAEERRVRLAAPPAAGQVVWVIDPLDGTRNFIRGTPFFACSVGAMCDGRPVAGAVVDVMNDQVFAAARGGVLRVTRTDGAPLAPPESQVRSPRPLVATPSSPTGQAAEVTRRWLERHVCRCLGSTALHLAYVAAGMFDAALCDNGRLWDIAAGCALLDAAGCRAARMDGGALFPIDLGAYAGEELPLIAAHQQPHETFWT